MKNNILKFLNTQLQKGSSTVVSYYAPMHAEAIKTIHKIKSETHMLLHTNEAYQLYAATKNTTKIKGDIAEVGTYKGGSAKLMASVMGDRSLYTFDTFEGLPEVTEGDGDTRFYKTQFRSSYDDVRRYLSSNPNVHVYKGVFPEHSDAIKDKKFSLVHLDVDLYQSTRDSLEFFYPRMSKGGVIISHDFSSHEGVQKAFDDFFADKPEPLVELSGSQVLAVKLA